MARRSAQPALYEMMHNRGSTPNVPIAQPVRPARDSHDADLEIELHQDEPAGSAPAILERLIDLLRPGQTVRIPVGYLLAACAGVFVLLIVLYMIGVSAGKSIQTAMYRERLGEGFEISLQRGGGGGGGGVNDPLTIAPANGRGDSDGGATGTAGSTMLNSDSASRMGSGGEHSALASNWGPIRPAADPRQPGWNYFIAATNTMSSCTSLAEFCRANGLETYVVAHKNGAQVIVFPGFQGSRQAPEVKALEQRIHQIGDKYKAANRYETNMRDAYPARFGG